MVREACSRGKGALGSGATCAFATSANRTTSREGGRSSQWFVCHAKGRWRRGAELVRRPRGARVLRPVVARARLVRKSARSESLHATASERPGRRKAPRSHRGPHVKTDSSRVGCFRPSRLSSDLSGAGKDSPPIRRRSQPRPSAPRPRRTLSIRPPPRARMAPVPSRRLLLTR
jgi:hypothetical protein